MLPTADAYVQAGSKTAGTNFGTATSLRIGTSGTLASNYDSYLKFDTSSVSGITNVKLRLYAALSRSGSVVSTAYPVATTTWGETTITWNNKPARGTALGNITVAATTYAWYEIDVTAYVQSEYNAGRKVVSFAYHNSASTTPYVTAHSKEGVNKPQLLITYTPLTVPGAPTIGTATAGNALATVTFTAPASNGGSAITSYTATSTPSGITGSCAASPCTVVGLTNGTAYTFSVKATNVIGAGSSSSASNSVTPATLPGAPIIGTGAGGNHTATVTFLPPASNGGSPIISYTVTCTPPGYLGVSVTGTSSPITVIDLMNGTNHSCAVTATNSVGTSASSAAITVMPLGLPGIPFIGTASAGNTTASVSFTTPFSNGGSTISGYTAISNPGGITGSCTASPCNVTGLANGTAYTFTVTATNAQGTGTASAASNSVTPATLPNAPTIGTATAGNTQASVTFTAPTSNGGSAITSYTATSNPGGITGSCTASPCNVTGLTNGTAYTFTVTATNAAGTSAASLPSNIIIPMAQPAALYYIETDHLDTPRQLTDSTGKVVWRWQSTDAFGANLPNEDADGDGIKTVFNLRMPGQYADKETGSFYNYFRDGYDPAIGRYNQSDPIGLRGGLNTYAYVGGNPISFVDPLGLDRWGDTSANYRYTPNAGKPVDANTGTALTCFSICVGGNKPGPGVTVTAGREGGHSSGSAHETGQACDIGKNSNPDLDRSTAQQCYQQCFNQSSSYGQEEGNHYHYQTRPGAGGATGFAPGVH